jgi:alkanesulfonate monooxygenase SsuD/methylene tetrahydromethanopterin reductase-like flavin-dependent oxidoreductase (luciferase family)
MSWHCPPAYLDEVARPALARGAASAGRDIPPIVAQAAVVVTEDRAAAREWARPHLVRFVQSPVYATMFAAAGFLQGDDDDVTDDLLGALVISGSEETITEELARRATVDEVFATHIPQPDPWARWTSSCERSPPSAPGQPERHASRRRGHVGRRSR